MITHLEILRKFLFNYFKYLRQNSIGDDFQWLIYIEEEESEKRKL